MIGALLYMVLEKNFTNFLSYLVIIKKMMKVVILWFHGYVCCTNSYIYIYTQIHKVMWGEKLQSILVEISLM